MEEEEDKEEGEEEEFGMKKIPIFSSCCFRLLIYGI